MSLNQMIVYNQYARTAMQETLREQINLFNSVTRGAIMLNYGASVDGDFDQSTFFARMPNLTRRRNPYGTGSISTVTPEMKEDVAVKIASGTPVLVYDGTQFDWINQNPEIAGALFGRQLAEDKFKEYLSLALGVTKAALSNNAATNVLDVTGIASPGNKLSWVNLVRASALFGDQAQDIKVWVSHSAPFHELLVSNLTNTADLFNFGDVVVRQDPLGRPIIISDNPELVNLTPTPDEYYVLGLTEGAVEISETFKFREASNVITGQENIAYHYQAEWEFMLRVKGYAWDKGNGGRAPNDAALLVNTNWDKNKVSPRDLAGVILECVA